MRHHPKSNNGHFSKKQKRASRIMMKSRFPMRDPGQKDPLVEDGKNMGIIAGLLSLMLGRRLRSHRGAR